VFDLVSILKGGPDLFLEWHWCWGLSNLSLEALWETKLDAWRFCGDVSSGRWIIDDIVHKDEDWRAWNWSSAVRNYADFMANLITYYLKCSIIPHIYLLQQNRFVGFAEMKIRGRLLKLAIILPETYFFVSNVTSSVWWSFAIKKKSLICAWGTWKLRTNQNHRLKSWQCTIPVNPHARLLVLYAPNPHLLVGDSSSSYENCSRSYSTDDFTRMAIKCISRSFFSLDLGISSSNYDC